MTQLHFSILIQAPKEKVWHTLLDDQPYRLWTSVFADGSYYEGSWEEGESIHFLTPDGCGMASEIAENRYAERVSIRHLGIITHGQVDTQSEEVKAWAPAYETYYLSEKGPDTQVKVTMDSVAEYEAYFQETWPKALAKLKELCEA